MLHGRERARPAGASGAPALSSRRTSADRRHERCHCTAIDSLRDNWWCSFRAADGRRCGVRDRLYWRGCARRDPVMAGFRRAPERAGSPRVPDRRRTAPERRTSGRRCRRSTPRRTSSGAGPRSGWRHTRPIRAHRRSSIRWSVPPATAAPMRRPGPSRIAHSRCCTAATPTPSGRRRHRSGSIGVERTHRTQFAPARTVRTLRTLTHLGR